MKGGFDMDKLFVSVVVIIAVLVTASFAYTMINANNDLGISAGLAALKSRVCTETDTEINGGRNFEVKGTTTKGDKSFTDYCSSTEVLVEYYCSNNNIKYARYPCVSCIEGTCAKQPF